MLKKEKLPTPQTIILHRPAAWQAVVKSSLRFPLVVKPVSASHAQGAILNITTYDELKHAVAHAFLYARKKREGRVLVEEHFFGTDLRLFVVGQRVVSTVKREPAYIVGDGKNTIRQLIKAFNKMWHSPIKYDLPLCPILIDRETSRCLASKQAKLTTVLPPGQKMQVRWNANVSTGGRAIDITDQVNPRLKDLAVRVAELSDLEIGGVDIMCKDYTSKDVSKNNVAILEINDAPGFDIHHFPFAGKGQNICTDILNHIFEQPNNESRLPIQDIEMILKKLQADAPPKTKVASENEPIQASPAASN